MRDANSSSEVLPDPERQVEPNLTPTPRTELADGHCWRSPPPHSWQTAKTRVHCGEREAARTEVALELQTTSPGRFALAAHPGNPCKWQPTCSVGGSSVLWITLAAALEIKIRSFSYTRKQQVYALLETLPLKAGLDQYRDRKHKQNTASSPLSYSTRDHAQEKTHQKKTTKKPLQAGKQSRNNEFLISHILFFPPATSRSKPLGLQAEASAFCPPSSGRGLRVKLSPFNFRHHQSNRRRPSHQGCDSRSSLRAGRGRLLSVLCSCNPPRKQNGNKQNPQTSPPAPRPSPRAARLRELVLGTQP